MACCYCCCGCCWGKSIKEFCKKVLQKYNVQQFHLYGLCYAHAFGIPPQFLCTFSAFDWLACKLQQNTSFALFSAVATATTTTIPFSVCTILAKQKQIGNQFSSFNMNIQLSCKKGLLFCAPPPTNSSQWCIIVEIWTCAHRIASFRYGFIKYTVCCQY